MQVSIRCRQVGGRSFEQRTGHARSLGGGQPGAALRQESSDFGRGAVDFDADACFGVSRVPRGVLGVFAALERVVQGEAIVARGHGGVGVFERIGRRGVLGCCVPFGAGRLRGVDGALGLIHFLVRRLRASGNEERREETRRRRTPRQAHEGLSIASMKEVAPHDRPREKLEQLGAPGLGDNELVAVVLGSGSRDADALELANRLIACAGGVHGLTRIGLDRLRHVPGVGPARAAQIVAAVELGRRTLVRDVAERPRLTTPRQLASYLIPQYGAGAVEQFGIVMLDTKHRVIRVRIVSMGSLDSTVVHPREVFREAASASAAAVVLFHNHPSGDPTPSPDDLVLTTRMVSAGDIMGIDVVDHLILADQRYFSLVEAGRLQPRVG